MSFIAVLTHLQYTQEHIYLVLHDRARTIELVIQLVRCDCDTVTDSPNQIIIITLEPHYNAHFGVHSDMSVITEQPYNEGLIHRKYKRWEPCL